MRTKTIIQMMSLTLILAVENPTFAGEKGMVQIVQSDSTIHGGFGHTVGTNHFEMDTLHIRITANGTEHIEMSEATTGHMVNRSHSAHHIGHMGAADEEAISTIRTAGHTSHTGLMSHGPWILVLMVLMMAAVSDH